jgi:hypothetical protein
MALAPKTAYNPLRTYSVCRERGEVFATSDFMDRHIAAGIFDPVLMASL